MKKEIIINILVLIGVIIFNIIFWKEGMGINTLIFTLFLIIGLFIKEKEIFQERSMQIISLGTIGFAVMIITNNSMYSKFLYVISSILMVGIAQQRSLRFLGYGLLVGLWSMCETPFKMWRNLWLNKTKEINYSKGFNTIKILIIPAVIVSVFFVIYSIANQKFAVIVFNKIDFVFNYFYQFDISWERVIFSVIGLLIIGGAIWKNHHIVPFEKEEENIIKDEKIDNINDEKQEDLSHKLKNEYKTAFITFLSLNVLLLFLNIVDAKHIWFKDVSGMSSVELKAMVHQGTYVLIFSIMMAMAVVVWFFRKNLNFFPDKQGLRIMSYLWIIQNAILALSVGIRNIRYIEEYGLAYKRVGVFVFLILTFAGLITMIIKVKKKKTVYFLVHRNAWIWYGVFWMTAWINWDISLTEYNLSANYNNTLDVDFVMNKISDKNLYLLNEKEYLIKNRKGDDWSDEEIEKAIMKKEYDFGVRKKEHSFWSWNMADARNWEYLEENK